MCISNAEMAGPPSRKRRTKPSGAASAKASSSDAKAAAGFCCARKISACEINPSMVVRRRPAACAASSTISTICCAASKRSVASNVRARISSSSSLANTRPAHFSDGPAFRLPSAGLASGCPGQDQDEPALQQRSMPAVARRTREESGRPGATRPALHLHCPGPV